MRTNIVLPTAGTIYKGRSVDAAPTADLRKSETSMAQQLLGSIIELTTEVDAQLVTAVSPEDRRHRETVSALLACAQTVSAQRDSELTQAADGLKQLQQADQAAESESEQLSAVEQKEAEAICSVGQMDRILSEVAAARSVAVDQLQHTLVSRSSTMRLPLSEQPEMPGAAAGTEAAPQIHTEALVTELTLQTRVSSLNTAPRPESRVSKREMRARLTDAASKMESRMQTRSAAQEMKAEQLHERLQAQHEQQLNTQLAAARSVSIAETRRAAASDVFQRVPVAQLSLLRDAQRSQLPVSWHEGTQVTPRGYSDTEMQTEPDREALNKQAFQKMDHCMLVIKWGAGAWNLLRIWAAQARESGAKAKVAHRGRKAEGKLSVGLWKMIVQREEQLRHSESLVHALADGLSELMGLHGLKSRSLHRCLAKEIRKSVARMGTTPKKPKKKQSKKARDGVDSSGWTCQKCTFRNLDLERAVCSICSADRHEASELVAAAQGAEGVVEPQPYMHVLVEVEELARRVEDGTEEQPASATLEQVLCDLTDLKPSGAAGFHSQQAMATELRKLVHRVQMLQAAASCVKPSIPSSGDASAAAGLDLAAAAAGLTEEKMMQLLNPTAPLGHSEASLNELQQAANAVQRAAAVAEQNTLEKGELACASRIQASQLLAQLADALQARVKRMAASAEHVAQSWLTLHSQCTRDGLPDTGWSAEQSRAEALSRARARKSRVIKSQGSSEGIEVRRARTLDMSDAAEVLVGHMQSSTALNFGPQVGTEQVATVNKAKALGVSLGGDLRVAKSSLSELQQAVDTMELKFVEVMKAAQRAVGKLHNAGWSGTANWLQAELESFSQLATGCAENVHHLATTVTRYAQKLKEQGLDEGMTMLHDLGVEIGCSDVHQAGPGHEQGALGSVLVNCSADTALQTLSAVRGWVIESVSDVAETAVEANNRKLGLALNQLLVCLFAKHRAQSMRAMLDSWSVRAQMQAQIDTEAARADGLALQLEQERLAARAHAEVLQSELSKLLSESCKTVAVAASTIENHKQELKKLQWEVDRLQKELEEAKKTVLLVEGITQVSGVFRHRLTDNRKYLLQQWQLWTQEQLAFQMKRFCDTKLVVSVTSAVLQSWRTIGVVSAFWKWRRCVAVTLARKEEEKTAARELKQVRDGLLLELEQAAADLAEAKNMSELEEYKRKHDECVQEILDLNKRAEKIAHRAAFETVRHICVRMVHSGLGGAIYRWHEAMAAELMVEKETEYHVGRFHRMKQEASDVSSTVDAGSAKQQLVVMQSEIRAAKGKAAACKLAYLVLVYRASRLGSVGGHSVWDLDLQSRSEVLNLQEMMQESITMMGRAVEKEHNALSHLIASPEKAKRSSELCRDQKELEAATIRLAELDRYNKFRAFDLLEPAAVQEKEAEMTAEQERRAAVIIQEQQSLGQVDDQLERAQAASRIEAMQINLEVAAGDLEVMERYRRWRHDRAEKEEWSRKWHQHVSDKSLGVLLNGQEKAAMEAAALLQVRIDQLEDELINRNEQLAKQQKAAADAAAEMQARIDELCQQLSAEQRPASHDSQEGDTPGTLQAQIKQLEIQKAKVEHQIETQEVAAAEMAAQLNGRIGQLETELMHTRAELSEQELRAEQAAELLQKRIEELMNGKQDSGQKMLKDQPATKQPAATGSGGGEHALEALLEVEAALETIQGEHEKLKKQYDRCKKDEDDAQAHVHELEDELIAHKEKHAALLDQMEQLKLNPVAAEPARVAEVAAEDDMMAAYRRTFQAEKVRLTEQMKEAQSVLSQAQKALVQGEDNAEAAIKDASDMLVKVKTSILGLCLQFANVLVFGLPGAKEQRVQRNVHKLVLLWRERCMSDLAAKRRAVKTTDGCSQWSRPSSAEGKSTAQLKLLEEELVALHQQLAASEQLCEQLRQSNEQLCEQLRQSNEQLCEQLQQSKEQLLAQANVPSAEVGTNTGVDDEMISLRQEVARLQRMLKRSESDQRQMKGWFKASSPDPGSNLVDQGLVDKLAEHERAGMLKLHNAVVKAYRCITHNLDADKNQRAVSPTGSPYAPPSAACRSPGHQDAMKSLSITDTSSMMKWDTEMLDVVYRWILTNVDAMDSLMNPTKHMTVGADEMMHRGGYLDTEGKLSGYLQAANNRPSVSRTKTRLGDRSSASRLTTPMIDARRSSTSQRNRVKNIFGSNTGMRHHQLADGLSKMPPGSPKYPFRAVDADFGLNSHSGREMLKTPNWPTRSAKSSHAPPQPPPPPMVELHNLFHN